MGLRYRSDPLKFFANRSRWVKLAGKNRKTAAQLIETAVLYCIRSRMSLFGKHLLNGLIESCPSKVLCHYNPIMVDEPVTWDGVNPVDLSRF